MSGDMFDQLPGGKGQMFRIELVWQFVVKFEQIIDGVGL